MRSSSTGASSELASNELTSPTPPPVMTMLSDLPLAKLDVSSKAVKSGDHNHVPDVSLVVVHATKLVDAGVDAAALVFAKVEAWISSVNGPARLDGTCDTKDVRVS